LVGGSARQSNQQRNRTETGAGQRPLGSGFWRLWTSAGLSDLADGIVKVALPLVAIGFTRSPALIAGLAFAFTLPWLLFALPAGALADRLDRRRAMLGANLVRASLLTVLVVAVVLHAASIWALYVVALCVGTAETLYDTSAQSILPQLVGREQLSRANARLFAAQLTASEFAGPPVAAVLVAAGATAAFVTPLGLWIVALGALLLVPGSFRMERERRTTMRSDIVEGLRFLWHQRILRTFAIMVGVFNFTTNAIFAIFVLYAVGPASAIGLSTQGYGLLLTTTAAGSLAGSLIAERTERMLGRARTIAVTSLVGALLVGVPAVTANPFAIGAVFFVGGAGVVISNVVMVSLRQRITPGRLLGRLNSCYRLVGWGTKPLGAAAGGLLAQFLGLRAVFAVMGLLALSTLAGLTVVTDAAMDAADGDASRGRGLAPGAHGAAGVAVQPERAGGGGKSNEREDEEGDGISGRRSGVAGEQPSDGEPGTQGDRRGGDAQPDGELLRGSSEGVGVPHPRFGDVAERQGRVRGESDRARHAAEHGDDDDDRQRGAAGEKARSRHRGRGPRGGGNEDGSEPEAVEQERRGGLDADIADEDEQHDGTGLHRAPAEDVLEKQRQEEGHGPDHQHEQRAAADRHPQRPDPQDSQVDERMAGSQQVPGGRRQQDGRSGPDGQGGG